jgi:hypothetical protein
MQPVEASVVVPLSPEEKWDFLLGDPQRLVESFADIVAVENFQMRPDGTPRYRMVRKLGPFTMSFISDYSVFERPYRTVSRALDTPFGETFYTTHERTTESTRMRWPSRRTYSLLCCCQGCVRSLRGRCSETWTASLRQPLPKGTSSRRRAGSARWWLPGRAS